MSARDYDKFWSTVESLVMTPSDTKTYRRVMERAVDQFVKLSNSSKEEAFNRLGKKARDAQPSIGNKYLALQEVLVEHLPAGADKEAARLEANLPTLAQPKPPYGDGERYQITLTKVREGWAYAIEDNKGQVFQAHSAPTIGGAVQSCVAPVTDHEEKARIAKLHPDRTGIAFELRDPDGDLIGESGHVSFDSLAVLKAVINLLGVEYSDKVRDGLETQKAFKYTSVWSDEMHTPIIANIVIQSGTRKYDQTAGEYVWDRTGDTLYSLNALPAAHEEVIEP